MKRADVKPRYGFPATLQARFDLIDLAQATAKWTPSHRKLTQNRQVDHQHIRSNEPG
jgi:hypothetical protein